MPKKKLVLSSVILIISVCLVSFAFIKQTNHGLHEIDPQTKAEVYKVLDNFMISFNARDRKAHYSTYHFPHYRLASGKMTILETPQSDTTMFLAGLVKAGWDHSAWEHRNIVQASGIKVHVDTRFIRYSADGRILGRYESLYILTKENGNWGIKMRSSFAE